LAVGGSKAAVHQNLAKLPAAEPVPDVRILIGLRGFFVRYDWEVTAYGI
jgi:hypothetical protein